MPTPATPPLSPDDAFEPQFTLLIPGATLTATVDDDLDIVGIERD